MDTDELSMTNLRSDNVNKVLRAKQNAVMEMSKSIPPPTVGGKDVRTSKQKLADEHTIKFQVAQKQLFDEALVRHQKEMEIVRSITQEQRSTNMQKLLENQTFMKDWMKEGKKDWRKN